MSSFTELVGHAKFALVQNAIAHKVAHARPIFLVSVAPARLNGQEEGSDDRASLDELFAILGVGGN